MAAVYAYCVSLPPELCDCIICILYLPPSRQSFVIAVTMLRELYDDLKRYLRDREVNSQRFYKLTPRGSPSPSMFPRSVLFEVSVSCSLQVKSLLPVAIFKSQISLLSKR